MLIRGSRCEVSVFKLQLLNSSFSERTNFGPRRGGFESLCRRRHCLPHEIPPLPAGGGLLLSASHQAIPKGDDDDDDKWNKALINLVIIHFQVDQRCMKSLMRYEESLFGSLVTELEEIWI